MDDLSKDYSIGNWVRHLRRYPPNKDQKPDERVPACGVVVALFAAYTEFRMYLAMRPDEDAVPNPDSLANEPTESATWHLLTAFVFLVFFAFYVRSYFKVRAERLAVASEQ